jgi:TPP-dependent pyruvate/acetoin dehydrogenase alpha subunit
MSGFTTKDAQQMLAQADETQGKTKDAITRMKQKTAETEAIGSATLDELRRQGEQMEDVNFTKLLNLIELILEINKKISYCVCHTFC